MIKKYYFEDSIIETKYPTLWNGYFEYDGKEICVTETYFQNSNKELDEILTNICDVNFYISLIDNRIYISLCRDSNYYSYQFEKDVKNMVENIEKKFDVKIMEGEFFANEVKHNGNYFKYTVTKNINKIVLKRKILSWNIDLDSKTKLENGIKKMKI